MGKCKNHSGESPNIKRIFLDEVLTYKNFFKSLRKCNIAVSYKYSVQDYNGKCCVEINEAIESMKRGEVPVIKDTRTVLIFERGKKRVICPIHIADRVIQKVLCDELLLPLISPHLIYDNGASLKGKGVSFSRARFDLFLEKAKRRFGSDNVYALIFDFTGFFENLSHAACFKVLEKYIIDPKALELIINIIESYKRPEIDGIKRFKERARMYDELANHKLSGISLGSQISQIMAIAAPNDFDHYIKDVLHEKFYIRHVDDGVILSDSKSRLKKVAELLSIKALEMGLTFNPKKTKIVKMTKGITFLKTRYRIVGNKTVKKIDKDGIRRERRKLKKFKQKVENGNMSLDDVYLNFQSYLSHARRNKSFYSVKRLLRLYNELYDSYKLT